LALKAKEPRSNIFLNRFRTDHYRRFIDGGIAVEKPERGAN
jgi:hypothetical protein